MTQDLTLAEIGTDAIQTQGINTNFSLIEDAVNAKAEINGDSTQVFNVADATESTQALNKGQLDNSVSAINTAISDLETEIDAQLATKVSISDIIVQANTILHVATTGNDTTGDGSENAPFATIQRALDELNGKILLGSVTVQVADGTYTTGFIVKHPQSNLINVLGNATTPSNCVINVTGAGAAVDVGQNNSLFMNGFKIIGNRTLESYGIKIYFNSSLNLGSSIIIDGFDKNLYVSCNSILYGHTGITLQNAITTNLECNALSYTVMPSCLFLGHSSTKTTYGINCSAQSFVYIGDSTITNSVTGSGAYNCSQIGQNGSTIYTNCTTNTSPLLNTLANNNAYISSNT